MSSTRHVRSLISDLGGPSRLHGFSMRPRGRRALSSKPPSSQDVSNQLRDVMRNVPQPVAVAVTRVPVDATSNPLNPPRTRYHGVTLSSFTSISLHPHPLVSFAVRLPSRMADYLSPPPKPPQLAPALQQLASNLMPDPPKLPLSPFPLPRPAQDLLASIQRLTAPQPATPGPRLTVSLLSKENESVAQMMSKPQSDQAEVFAMDQTWDTAEPPALLESIGRLRCEVVTSIPLRDVSGGGNADDGNLGTHHGSELYICRVLEVEIGEHEGGEPMLYWRRKYIGVKDVPDS